MINVHIQFNGQCEQAFKFYQSILGGELTLFRYSDSPDKITVPDNWQNKIVHGSLALGTMVIAATDVVDEHYVKPQGFHLLLQLQDEAQSTRIFNVFQASGKVILPLEKTYWSSLYGIVVDQFGISWEVNYAAD